MSQKSVLFVRKSIQRSRTLGQGEFALLRTVGDGYGDLVRHGLVLGVELVRLEDVLLDRRAGQAGLFAAFDDRLLDLSGQQRRFGRVGEPIT